MSLRIALVVVTALGVLGCQDEKPGIRSKSAASARGKTFTVPVPPGYLVVTDERFTKQAPNGVVLFAEKRVQPGAFIGSIVITEVATAPSNADTNTEAGCVAAAEGVTRVSPTVLERPGGLVATSVGTSCQWRIHDKEDPKRHAIGTYMYRANDDSWVVTCNYDERDPGAVEACERVLAGFRFTPK